MKIIFYNEAAFNTFYDWTVVDRKISKKISALIKDIGRTPYDGLGKPEALKNELSGWYSRHITDEHRLVYKVEDDMIEILSCKGHYE
jgi:toxin YoeB